MEDSTHTQSNSTNKPAKQISTIKNFFAGGFGGICLVAAGHPLDTVKVRMQITNVELINSSTTVNNPNNYNGTIDCVRKIFNNEGLRGFYKGMATPLIGVAPLYSICFFGYSLGKKLQTPIDFDSNKNEYVYSPIQIFNAGMLSSVFTNFITTPGERIKCLLQIQQSNIGKLNLSKSSNMMVYNGPVDCAIKLYRNGGVRSLYRGTIATLMRDVPAGGAYFVTYELLQRNLHDKNDRNNLSVWRTLFAGGMSGIVFWIFALPADVIKSRLQTSPLNHYPNGINDVFKEIYHQEGFIGFYRGGMAVFLRAFPANAACFFGYELAMKFIEWIAPDL